MFMKTVIDRRMLLAGVAATAAVPFLNGCARETLVQTAAGRLILAAQDWFEGLGGSIGVAGQAVGRASYSNRRTESTNGYLMTELMHNDTLSDRTVVAELNQRDQRDAEAFVRQYFRKLDESKTPDFSLAPGTSVILKNVLQKPTPRGSLALLQYTGEGLYLNSNTKYA